MNTNSSNQMINGVTPDPGGDQEKILTENPENNPTSTSNNNIQQVQSHNSNQVSQLQEQHAIAAQNEFYGYDQNSANSYQSGGCIDPNQLIMYALASGQISPEILSQLLQQSTGQAQEVLHSMLPNQDSQITQNQVQQNSQSAQNQQNTSMVPKYSNGSTLQQQTQMNPEMQISDIINQAGSGAFQNYIAHLMYNANPGFMNNQINPQENLPPHLSSNNEEQANNNGDQINKNPQNQDHQNSKDTECDDGLESVLIKIPTGMELKCDATGNGDVQKITGPALLTIKIPEGTDPIKVPVGYNMNTTKDQEGKRVIELTQMTQLPAGIPANNLPSGENQEVPETSQPEVNEVLRKQSSQKSNATASVSSCHSRQNSQLQQNLHNEKVSMNPNAAPFNMGLNGQPQSPTQFMNSPQLGQYQQFQNYQNGYNNSNSSCPQSPSSGQPNSAQSPQNGSLNTIQNGIQNLQNGLQNEAGQAGGIQSGGIQTGGIPNGANQEHLMQQYQIFCRQLQDEQLRIQNEVSMQTRDVQLARQQQQLKIQEQTRAQQLAIQAQQNNQTGNQVGNVQNGRLNAQHSSQQANSQHSGQYQNNPQANNQQNGQHSNNQNPNSQHSNSQHSNGQHSNGQHSNSQQHSGNQQPGGSQYHNSQHPNTQSNGHVQNSQQVQNNNNNSNNPNNQTHHQQHQNNNISQNPQKFQQHHQNQQNYSSNNPQQSFSQNNLNNQYRNSSQNTNMSSISPKSPHHLASPTPQASGPQQQLQQPSSSSSPQVPNKSSPSPSTQNHMYQMQYQQYQEQMTRQQQAYLQAQTQNQQAGLLNQQIGQANQMGPTRMNQQIAQQMSQINQTQNNGQIHQNQQMNQMAQNMNQNPGQNVQNMTQNHSTQNFNPFSQLNGSQNKYYQNSPHESFKNTSPLPQTPNSLGVNSSTSSNNNTNQLAFNSGSQGNQSYNQTQNQTQGQNQRQNQEVCNPHLLPTHANSHHSSSLNSSISKSNIQHFQTKFLTIKDPPRIVEISSRYAAISWQSPSSLRRAIETWIQQYKIKGIQVTKFIDFVKNRDKKDQIEKTLETLHKSYEGRLSLVPVGSSTVHQKNKLEAATIETLDIQSLETRKIEKSGSCTFKKLQQTTTQLTSIQGTSLKNPDEHPGMKKSVLSYRIHIDENTFETCGVAMYIFGLKPKQKYTIRVCPGLNPEHQTARQLNLNSSSTNIPGMCQGSYTEAAEFMTLADVPDQPNPPCLVKKKAKKSEKLGKNSELDTISSQASSESTVLSISENNSLNMKWSTPETNGESIIEYILEYHVVNCHQFNSSTANQKFKEIYKGLDKSVRLPGTTSVLYCPKFQENRIYQFRVRATNKIGSSVPSNPLCIQFDKNEPIEHGSNLKGISLFHQSIVNNSKAGNNRISEATKEALVSGKEWSEHVDCSRLSSSRSLPVVNEGDKFDKTDKSDRFNKPERDEYYRYGQTEINSQKNSKKFPQTGKYDRYGNLETLSKTAQEPPKLEKSFCQEEMIPTTPIGSPSAPNSISVPSISGSISSRSKHSPPQTIFLVKSRSFTSLHLQWSLDKSSKHPKNRHFRLELFKINCDQDIKNAGHRTPDFCLPVTISKPSYDSGDHHLFQVKMLKSATRYLCKLYRVENDKKNIFTKLAELTDSTKSEFSSFEISNNGSKQIKITWSVLNSGTMDNTGLTFQSKTERSTSELNQWKDIGSCKPTKCCFVLNHDFSSNVVFRVKQRDRVLSSELPVSFGLKNLENRSEIRSEKKSDNRLEIRAESRPEIRQENKPDNNSETWSEDSQIQQLSPIESLSISSLNFEKAEILVIINENSKINKISMNLEHGGQVISHRLITRETVLPVVVKLDPENINESNYENIDENNNKSEENCTESKKKTTTESKPSSQSINFKAINVIYSQLEHDTDYVLKLYPETSFGRSLVPIAECFKTGRKPQVSQLVVISDEIHAENDCSNVEITWKDTCLQSDKTFGLTVKNSDYEAVHKISSNKKSLQLKPATKYTFKVSLLNFENVEAHLEYTTKQSYPTRILDLVEMDEVQAEMVNSDSQSTASSSSNTQLFSTSEQVPVTLNFTIPADNGSPIESYLLECTHSQNTILHKFNYPPFTLQLISNQKYQFSVSSQNSFGKSAVSNVLNIKTRLLKPAPPLILTEVLNNCQGVKFKFDESSIQECNSPASYRLQIRASGQKAWKDIKTQMKSKQHFEFKELPKSKMFQEGSLYILRACGKNEVGEGIYRQSQFTTSFKKPSKVVKTSFVVTGGVFSWTAAGFATGYKLLLSKKFVDASGEASEIFKEFLEDSNSFSLDMNGVRIGDKVKVQALRNIDSVVLESEFSEWFVIPEVS